MFNLKKEIFKNLLGKSKREALIYISGLCGEDVYYSYSETGKGIPVSLYFEFQGKRFLAFFDKNSRRIIEIF